MYRKGKKGLSILLVLVLMVTGIPIDAWGYGEVAVATEYSLSMDVAQTETYKDWKNANWTDETSSDSGKVMMTPGADASKMNFAWYSENNQNEWLEIGEDAFLSQPKIYNAKSKSIAKKNWKITYQTTNRVTVTGLKENSKYYYRYSGEPTKIYSFQTRDTSHFQTILVGDPQIGASGSEKEGTKDDVNIPADTYSWEQLIKAAVAVAPQASFVMSAGDQINFKLDTKDTLGVRESEYAGLMYPEELRAIPFAPAIGNHESKGDDFSLHYNLPSASKYGSTNAGGDYYFSYGSVLFLVLNSNSRNMTEHKKFMKNAIAKVPNAKWRVVMFHHDIYGSGVLHSNGSAANTRILFAPLMDQYKIDLVLSGHDHSYARSYQMYDGTAIQYGSTKATNPYGTLYVAVGSSTGSKFYGLASQKQYYVAQRSNDQKQTFSVLDFTDTTLSIRVYDLQGNAYATPYTITKTKKKETPDAPLKKASKIQKKKYTKSSRKRFEQAYKRLKNDLKVTKKDQGYTFLVSNYQKTKDPLTYYANANPGMRNSTFGRYLLKRGFSTLLDKTVFQKNKVKKTRLNTDIKKLSKAIKQLKKK